MATSAAITALLGKLAATTDDTETVRVLAAAELPRENAFYQAHLGSAETGDDRAAHRELDGP